MKKEGWWSGELHIHRPPEDIELLDAGRGPARRPGHHLVEQSEHLWKDKRLPEQLLVQFDGNRFYHLMAGEDEREGGALLYFNLAEPLPIAGAKPRVSLAGEVPAQHERPASTPGVHVDVEKPFWWDVPVWVATGRSIRSAWPTTTSTATA